jgi:hypothetical protein
VAPAGDTVGPGRRHRPWSPVPVAHCRSLSFVGLSRRCCGSPVPVAHRAFLPLRALRALRESGGHQFQLRIACSFRWSRGGWTRGSPVPVAHRALLPVCGDCGAGGHQFQLRIACSLRWLWVDDGPWSPVPVAHRLPPPVFGRVERAPGRLRGVSERRHAAGRMHLPHRNEPEGLDPSPDVGSTVITAGTRVVHRLSSPPPRASRYW